MTNTFFRVVAEDNRILFTFTGSPSEEDCKKFFECMDKIYSNCKPFIVLFDAAQMKTASYSHIKLFAKYMKERQDLTKKFMKRAAIVANNTVVRAVINTLFKLRKPVTDIKIFKTDEQAKVFLRQVELPRTTLELAKIQQ